MFYFLHLLFFQAIKTFWYSTCRSNVYKTSSFVSVFDFPKPKIRNTQTQKKGRWSVKYWLRIQIEYILNKTVLSVNIIVWFLRQSVRLQAYKHNRESFQLIKKIALASIDIVGTTRFREQVAHTLIET